jgi:hypothetical protein
MSRRTTFLAALLALGALSSAAQADSRWRVSLGKSTKHGSIEIALGGGHAQHGRHGGRPRGLARKVWVPGHSETVQRKVWVPGGWREEWVPPVFETRWDACGRAVRVQVGGGYARKVALPGRWEIRAETVWHPGHWEVRRY